MAHNDTAFIGFTYGGEHSITNYKIYRTSNGDRYEHNLTPQMMDKTADVPGGDGQYYFKTNYKTRQFSIPIAFDELDQDKFDAMKKWLSGKEIKPLKFDGEDITYSAKVTGTPQLKFVCFDNNGQNIYKGEGTIQFTCYFPFGWQEDYEDWSASSSSNLSVNENISIGGQLPTTFVFTGSGIQGNVKIGDLEITPGVSNFTWDSKTGLVKNSNNNQVINYSGTGYGTIGTVNNNDEIGLVNVSFSLSANGKAILSWKKLYY